MTESERATPQKTGATRRKSSFGDPDASLIDQMGGIRGLVYSSIPILTFVPLNGIWGLTAAIWGFGVSLGFPVGVSAASDEPRHAAARVSVVSTIAYGAFLAGPPALGFLGDHWGVLRALGVVSALLVVAIVALPALRPPRTDSPPE